MGKKFPVSYTDNDGNEDEVTALMMIMPKRK